MEDSPMEERPADEDAPRPKAKLATPALDSLGVVELQSYIDELRSEIVRAEDMITKKLGHRSAADSVFRRP